MFRVLTPPNFSAVQGVLFPIFFLFQVALLANTLAAWAGLIGVDSQFYSIAASLAAAALNCFVLGPLQL